MGGRHRLSARKVETAKAGMNADGHGLYLLVKLTGARSWVLRYQLEGRRRDMGLGPWPAVSLARAREKAQEARAMLADKRDPLTERKKPAPMTFKQAAELTIAAKAPGWKSAKHADQWRSTLAQHVYPKLGDRPVAAIDTQDVLDVLSPIWSRIPETASRVRMRVEAVLSFATAINVRTGDNAAQWRGRLEHSLAKPSRIKPVTHFAALDWRQIPDFWPKLVAQQGVAALALGFAILTAARSGEVRGATWQEIDLDAALWVIASNRMKAQREHRIPLSKPALAILDQVRGLDKALAFPGARRGRPLSDMSLTATLRRMAAAGEVGHTTAHGFRSSFRDWAGESTHHPREVIEHALAHRIKDRAEAAYARGDLMEKRRALMSDWARFVTKN